MLPLFVLGTYLLSSWLISLGLQRNTSIYEKSPVHNAHNLIFFTLPPLILGLYFIGFRPFNAGGDTVAYLSAFGRISNPLTATVDAHYGTEILFWPTQALLKAFLDDRGWLVTNYLVIASLTYIAYKKTLKDTKLSPLIFALAFTTFFAVYTGNAMRQVYSIPIGLLAFHYFYQKETQKFLIFSVLATCFHWSAVIVFLYPIFAKVPNKTKYYIALPALAFVSSPLISIFIDTLASVTGFSWLIEKTNLYFKGGRISHIGAVWETTNFWLCIAIYAGLLITNSIKSYEKISKYLLMILSLMLFSISNPDVSERYMVWFVFSVPISVAIILSTIKIPAAARNSVYSLLFLAMAVLVFTRASAVETLGIVL